LPGQIKDPSRPIIIDGEQKWEVKKIFDSKKPKGRLKYRVQWLDYPKDLEWYDADGPEFTYCQELVDEFHERYPHKSR